MDIIAMTAAEQSDFEDDPHAYARSYAASHGWLDWGYRVFPDSILLLPLDGVERRSKPVISEKKRAAMLGRIDRLRSQLANEDFLSRAPSHVVEECRRRLAEAEREYKASVEES